MKNANKPAVPLPLSATEEDICTAPTHLVDESLYTGLTKHEEFAKVALGALLTRTTKQAEWDLHSIHRIVDIAYMAGEALADRFDEGDF